MVAAEDVWVLVPARGGSKGIPRKNLRALGSKPLLRHVLDELRKGYDPTHLILSTDDAEISAAAGADARLHPRRAEDANDKATLDQVAVDAARWLLTIGARAEDILITVQPTSPFIRLETLRTAERLIREGARSVLTVRDDRHLRWTRDAAGRAQPMYAERVNRQWMAPTLAETGGVIATRIGDLLRTQTRINAPTSLIEVDQKEGLDIDSHADWAVAEFHLARRKILIRADAAPTLGMGHVYRAIALATEMAEHDVLIVTRADGDHALGASFLAQHPFPQKTVGSEKEFLDLLGAFRPHVAVLDILDTSEDQVAAVKASADFVVSLEDLGAGSRLADLVINDLYTDLYPQANHWYGVNYAILAPQFEGSRPAPLRESVSNILVAFGGTDQHDLTARVLAALQMAAYRGEVTVVLGPGYAHAEPELAKFGLQGRVHRSVKNMAELMRSADVAITSAGRTVTELMTLGVPTLALCQNMRELRHTHASSPYGVMNLGLGMHVDGAFLASHITTLLQDKRLREDMRARALNAVKERSNRRLCQRILAAAEERAQSTGTRT